MMVACQLSLLEPELRSFNTEILSSGLWSYQQTQTQSWVKAYGKQAVREQTRREWQGGSLSLVYIILFGESTPVGLSILPLTCFWVVNFYLLQIILL